MRACCLLLIAAAGLTGCQDAEKLKSIESELNTLKQTVEATTDRVADIGSDVLSLQLKQNPYETASFDPTKPKGYGRVDSVSGAFLVSLENVEPHFDGVRVTAEIGNLLSATYQGVTIVATYGRRVPTSNDSVSPVDRRKNIFAYNEAKKTTTVRLTDTLRPATWTRVSFVLPDIKPAEFGELNIKIRTDEVNMARFLQR